jgi:hypothetical protein
MIYKAAMNIFSLEQRTGGVGLPVAVNSNIKAAVAGNGAVSRLEAAVAIMVAELEIQKRGMARSRAKMAELDIVMRRIEGRFFEFQQALSNIKVRDLRRKSLRLAALCRRAEKT